MDTNSMILQRLWIVLDLIGSRSDDGDFTQKATNAKSEPSEIFLRCYIAIKNVF